MAFWKVRKFYKNLYLSEFLLPTPLDGRLHLISVERNPSIGTTGNGHLLTIRVDNALRHVHLDEIPIASLDGQLPRVELRPFHTGNGEGEDSKEMTQSGCIEGGEMAKNHLK